jgi:hypothetical protein
LHVKSLVLVFGTFFDTYDVQFVRTIAVLKLCSNIETLALPGFFAHALQRNALRELQKFMTFPGLSPRRLHIGSSLFARDQQHFFHPIFRQVTHLEFLCKASRPEKWDWSTLRRLPQLTHLSIHMPDGEIAY